MIRGLKKRELSPYQKQIRFLTLFFGVLAVSIAIILFWLVNSVFQPVR